MPVMKCLGAHSRIYATILFIFVIFTHFTESADAGDGRSAKLEEKQPTIDRSLAIDGLFVHNVGKLQMNVTNWGLFGSLPSSNYPMAESPSAQWPAGSGVEYLYAAGLWVGALKNGIPLVSTGYPETEFYPSDNPVDRIYRTFDGDIGGKHYPDNPDDDYDGLIDEDWLNGIDDDGDGAIDEDYAAVGTQMFSCWFSDDQPKSTIIWPEHTPLHVKVRQESYQWSEDGDNEYVGVRYYIENTGNDYLSDVYYGIYADVDAGPRGRSNYHRDDQVGFIEDIRCSPFGEDQIPVRVNVAYVYDDDEDGGITTGYFGVSMINYPMRYHNAKYKELAFRLPDRMFTWVNAFRVFSSLLPFESGGEPTNDQERYKALSEWQWDEDTLFPNDYKILVSVGDFELDPGDEPFVLDIAFVAGEGLDGMLQSAANAALRFDGIWVDADKDILTGIDGRETPALGPLDTWYPDACKDIDWVVHVEKGETCWTNYDCYLERWKFAYSGCFHPYDSYLKRFQTGVDGKEHQVHWVSGVAPPPPNMRVAPGDHEVMVFWDDFSETVIDPLLLRSDFEGYQVWRADNWHRPLGTNILNGPSPDLWRLMETRDIVNGVKPDIDFHKPYSSGGWEYEPVAWMADRDDYIRMFEETIWYSPMDTVPCPPGLDDLECDTLEALARYNLGLEGGKRYYKYIDRTAKNGIPYFYAVTAYDHKLTSGVPSAPGRYAAPEANFMYIEACSGTQSAEEFDGDKVYVVPNPVTTDAMQPWQLGPTNADPSGIKCEFRNLPACFCTVRIYTIAGDLVQTLIHQGDDGNGSLKWNLLSRNGQDVTSGVYLYSVEPEDHRFQRTVGKFVVIR